MSIRKKIKKAKAWGAPHPLRPNIWERDNAEGMNIVRRVAYLWNPWAIAVRVHAFTKYALWANSKGAVRPW